MLPYQFEWQGEVVSVVDPFPSAVMLYRYCRCARMQYCESFVSLRISKLSNERKFCVPVLCLFVSM